MPDPKVTIGIGSTYEDAGAKESLADLQELRRQAYNAGVSTAGLDKEISAAEKSLGAAGKGAAGMTGHVTGLHRALGLLGHQAGYVGTIMRYVWSWQSAAIAAVAIGIHYAIAKWKEWNAEMQRSADLAAMPLTASKAKFDELKIAALEANTAFVQSMETLTERSKLVEATISAEKTAVHGLIQTYKILALARAPDEASRKEVAARFKDLEEEVSLNAELASLADKQTQMQAKQAALFKLGDVRALTGGRTKEQLEAALKLLPGDLENIEARKKKLDEERGKMPEMVLALEGRPPLYVGPESPPPTLVPNPEIKAVSQEISALITLQQQREHEREQFAKGLAALKTEEELTKAIRELTAEIAGRKAQISVGRSGQLAERAAAAIQGMEAAVDILAPTRLDPFIRLRRPSAGIPYTPLEHRDEAIPMGQTPQARVIPLGEAPPPHVNPAQVAIFALEWAKYNAELVLTLKALKDAMIVSQQSIGELRTLREGFKNSRMR
jgi:hypothetical protein